MRIAKQASEYRVLEVLHTSPRTTLYRALWRGGTGAEQRVILKVLGPEHRPADVDRLRNEFELERALDVASVVRPLALDTFEGMPALVLTDFGGEPLDRILGAPVPVGEVLPIAHALATALAAVHASDIVHKDIKPENILLNRVTGEVRLTDFSISSRIDGRANAKASRLIEGSLPYMPPEQTGRMNRAVDGRSDLYSLGVVLYQLLTGRLPFEARDALEWAHCHIARAPRPIAEIEPKVPMMLSAIVLRLLAKLAEDRYQTAAGLTHDLARCLDSWRETGDIPPFPLGERDASDRLRVPQKLFGREAELAALVAAFEGMLDTGNQALVMVSGYAGVGKSSLVRELEKRVMRERGFFLEGKFDQYKRNIPYLTIVQAFRELIGQILCDAEERVAGWKQKLEAALCTDGQVIADVIPQIELIVGPQPPVPELAPADAQIRFATVFLRFISVFTAREHPVVLFLDDLQWVDAASLRLLQLLAADRDPRHLGVIGAYRENEVGPAHPLAAALAALREGDRSVLKIALPPLQRESLALLVGEMLRAPLETALPLAELVAEKTGGNPFFAVQFITALHDKRLITFDRGQLAWRLDVEAIRAQAFTDNVLELMIERLKRLPPETQEVLELAACVGSAPDLATLAMVLDCPMVQVRRLLAPALREALMVEVDGAPQFLHDRVQQAAYSLVPPRRRAETHLRIGRSLLARMQEGELEEHVFDVVNQLHLGAACLSDGPGPSDQAARAERERIAALSLVAGERARAQVAYASAAGYFAAGVALLPEKAWETHYDLAFRLHLGGAECEWLDGNPAEAERLLAVVLARARTRIDLASAYRVRCNAALTQGDVERAVAAGLECLRLFDLAIPAHPDHEEVRRRRAELDRHLGERPLEVILALPEMSDPEVLAAMHVLDALYAPAFLTDVNLFFVHLAQMVRLGLEHGSTGVLVPALAWYGFGLVCQFADYELGRRYCESATALAEHRGYSGHRAGVHMALELTAFWTRPIETMIVHALAGIEAGVESGEFPRAAFLCNNLIADRLATGEPLATVFEESVARRDFVRRIRFAHIEDAIVLHQQYIKAMRGLTAEPGSLDDASFSEARFEAALPERPKVLACGYNVLKLMTRFMAGRYDQALAAAAAAEPVLWALVGHQQRRDHVFYHALALAARSDGSAGDLTALERDLDQLRTWAKINPTTFFDQYALVSAELARLGGHVLDAEGLYEKAIIAAREAGFVHHEAIAHERAAAFYRARGFEAFADLYLREAAVRYQRWGADAMVAKLRRENPRLGLEAVRFSPSATFTLPAETLDVLSIVKASQTISREIELGRLVCTLLRVTLEQAGASKGLLIRARNGTMTVEASGRSALGEVQVELLSPPVPLSPAILPTAVINFAWRTREPVVIEDTAGRPGAWSSDPYFQAQRPRSILCLPIVRQGEGVGLIYLENELVGSAFSPGRLAALELLAAQVAISLENALLLDRERERRAQAEDAERRAAFLAEAGAILAASLEIEQVLEALAQLTVRALADWCVIDLVDNGQVRRVAGAHVDPAKKHLIEQMKRVHTPGPESRSPAGLLLQGGKALLLSEITDEMIKRSCPTEEHGRLVYALGSKTAIAVPLLARGATIGALTLAAGEGRRPFTPADLDLAQELARRAAVAVDNAALYRQAQDAVRVREEFLSVASHELNTPMTSLRLNLQMLLRPPGGKAISPESRAALLARAEKQADRVVRLTSELLDVAHIQRGPPALSPDRTDLRAIVQDVIQRSEADLARVGCAVDLDGPPTEGCWDRSRLEQVITNLLTNAAKFGAGAPIEIRVGRSGDRAWLTVRDHGIGIPPERQGRIFDRFERAVSVQHYGGLGLGLYISREIVAAHGGTIRVDSRPGEGATFTVELPCEAPDRGATTAGPAKPGVN